MDACEENNRQLKTK